MPSMVREEAGATPHEEVLVLNFDKGLECQYVCSARRTNNPAISVLTRHRASQSFLHERRGDGLSPRAAFAAQCAATSGRVVTVFLGTTWTTASAWPTTERRQTDQVEHAVVLPARSIFATAGHEADVEAHVWPKLSPDTHLGTILVQSETRKIDQNFVPDKRNPPPILRGEVHAQLIAVTITSFRVAPPNLETIAIVVGEGAETSKQVRLEFESSFLIEMARRQAT